MNVLDQEQQRRAGIVQRVLAVLADDLRARGGVVTDSTLIELVPHVEALLYATAVEGPEMDTGDDYYQEGHVHVSDFYTSPK